jgi:hypothetical protein
MEIKIGPLIITPPDKIERKVEPITPIKPVDNQQNPNPKDQSAYKDPNLGKNLDIKI